MVVCSLSPMLGQHTVLEEPTDGGASPRDEQEVEGAVDRGGFVAFPSVSWLP